MPRLYTNSIPDTQCIGDSLDTINNNSLNLDTAVQDLSSQTINITDTSTIDLVYDAESRNLTASVKLSSISNSYLTPTFTLSASQISNESKPTNFKKFRYNLGDKNASTFYRTSLFISQDGSLYAAGYGAGYYFGQGSDGMQYAGNGWRKLMLPLLEGEFVNEVHLGGLTNASMYVLTNLKNIYATGYNGYGQLGDGTTTGRQIWVKVPITNVEWFSVGAGSDDAPHCLVVNTAGELWGWGYNGNGNLGLGNTTSPISTPTRINTGDIAGKIIKKCFAFSNYSRSYVIDSNDLVYSTGYNGYGQLGQNNTANLNRFTSIHQQLTLPADYIVSSTASDSCAFLIRNNEIWSCGYNGYGQLGLGDTTQRNSFTKINGISVDQISLSRDSGATSVIVKQLDGTLRAWGYNGYGQLGTGSTTQRNSPTTPIGNPQNVVKVKSFDITYAHTSFLNAAGEIWSTGYNGHGQLGVGDASQKEQFTKVIMNNNLKFKDFDLSGYSSGSNLIAVDQNGELWACGYNGQHAVAVPYINQTITVLQKTLIIN
jgi:alpha-tubulin suppressor-like RCC1 family protein